MVLTYSLKRSPVCQSKEGLEYMSCIQSVSPCHGEVSQYAMCKLGQSINHGWTYWICTQNFFSIQLKNHTEHAMSSRMLWTKETYVMNRQSNFINPYPKLTVIQSSYVTNKERELLTGEVPQLGIITIWTSRENLRCRHPL